MSLFAQGQISGQVANTDGEALVGASVVVQGTSRGVLTDNEGKYSIQASEGDVLVVSYLGHNTQEVTVGTSNTVNISLAPDEFALSEVVVTGYATQRKEDLTGSVAVVNTEELTAIPTSNVANQLQGRVAGVNVGSDGRPGAPSKVRIRGFASFQNNDPLYVVDGVPTQDISTLNPNDIEAISVLKDAGAASIYGSRASNGVIIVTTKRGSEGVNVGYSGYIGVQTPAGSAPTNLLNAQEYADLQWLVYANDGTEEEHPIYGDSNNPSPTLPSWGADTDWWDQITRNALITNHDVTLSGGSRNAKFYGGFNYFRQEGITLNTYSQRFSVRFNSEFNVRDRVTIGQNFTVTNTNNGQGIGQNAESAPISRVYQSQSIIPAVMTQEVPGISRVFVPGEYGGTGLAPRLGNGQNYFATLERDADDWSFNLRALGSVYADVEIFDGLNFRSTFGGTFGTSYFNNYNFATYERAENVATPSFSEGAGWGGDWVWTNTLTFNKSYDVHDINAVLGYEAVKYGIGRGVSGNRAGYFTDAVSFRTLDNGSTIVNASSGVSTPTALVSQFARVDYGFDNRYLLSATVRRDGSSRFGESTRFGIFPSVTAAWRVSQESFLVDNNIVSNLKIRGGYGTMGNQLAVSPQNAFFLFGGSPNTSFYDLNGTSNSSLQGFRPTRIGNPDAKWETNVTTNIGFDAAFLDNRLELVFDFYTKVSQDLLFNPELPGTAGAAATPFVNVAEMRNQGIDLQLIYRDQWTPDLGFEANLTFTTYDNEIVNIADGIEFFDFGGSRIGSFNRNQVGQPISSFFGFQVDGIFQNQEEVDNHATQDGAEPGFLKFADLDGDGEITPDDRTFIGNPNPDFTGGLNLALNYKNFDLTAFFFGSYGNDIFNFNRWWLDFWPSFQNQKSTDLLYNSWTPERTDATVPKASNKSNFSTNTQSTSYYIEDGSYLRLRNLQLGYTYNANPGAAIKNIRVYVQAANLFTLTNYSGIDPELNTRDDREIGVDEGTYPAVKQYLLGFSIGF
ncbi:MAG: TonB-dependent receptor [Bacteroidota bacterium]